MGREVRRVPANWQHPKDRRGDFIPLHDGFNKCLAEWDEANTKWQEGLRSDWHGGWKPLDERERGMPFSEWDGERPTQEEYMPDWPSEERTHYQMYETTTEGMIGLGSTPSAVMAGTVMQSGVAALGGLEYEREHVWPEVIE